jgi:dGTPase
MTIRERQEQLEKQLLSPYAQLSIRSKGRQREIAPCDLRTAYQRDRDRIIHCKSFRRLKYKTQVFLSPEGDHYRTRLTHTLEVSQIARTIARALRLNEDLTEAIALGHDLGHTPFGHVGENVLAARLPGGFEHNQESLRIVEKLENGCGLNLSWEVRDGIVNHKKSGNAATLEGKIVSYADRIAYINHDIDDALRGGVLKEGDLPGSCIAFLGDSHGKRIDTMIRDIVYTSMEQNFVRMSEECEGAMGELRDFMFQRVYTDPVAKHEESKARYVIDALFDHYMEHPGEISEEFRNWLQEDGLQVVAADYIACMTDRFAIRKYQQLFVPKGWAN